MMKTLRPGIIGMALTCVAVGFFGAGCSQHREIVTGKGHAGVQAAPPPSSVSATPVPEERIAEVPQPLAEPPAAQPAEAPVQPGEPAPAAAESSASPSPEPAPLVAPVVPMGLSDVYFEFNRFFVPEDAKTALKANADVLKARSLGKIVVEGHCDERGTRDYNLLLGEQRAVAVKDYLEKLGIPGSRIEAVSYGEEKPTCTEHQEGCWRQNRRAHVVVMPQSP